MKRLRTAVILIACVLSCTAAAQQHVNQKQGFNANDVYAVHDIDSINAFNGNLTVSIPLGPEFSLAEGFSYRVTLHSNGNFWHSENRDDTYAEAKPSAQNPAANAEGLCDDTDGFTVAFPHPRSNAGLGWTLTLGRLYPSRSSLVGNWTYESSSGADHEFEPADANGVRYTKDATYIRLIDLNDTAGTATVEFPDGQYHRFRRISTKTEDPWLPVEIAHRRSNKKLTIDYSAANVWKLTDSHGRTHKIAFTSLAWESGTRPLVTSVSLNATDAAATKFQSEYALTYEVDAAMRRPDWHEDCPEWPSQATVQLLKRVSFPSTAEEGTIQYGFDYDVGPLQSPGLLSRATLPTGGSIRWHYDTYQKPHDSAAADAPYFSSSVGVWKRELWRPRVASDPAGEDEVKVGEWTYTPTLNGTFNDTKNPVREARTAIKDAAQNTTVSFFSVSVWDGVGTDGIDYRVEEYGLPFTRRHVDDGRYLSQVIYPPGVTPNYAQPLLGAIRAVYVEYDSDGARSTQLGAKKNWRVKRRREVTYKTGGRDYIDTDSDQFDGYGHYEKITTEGSFGGASRTVTTNYLAPTSCWVLGSYDSVKVKVTTTDGAAQTASESETKYHFDSDGFLARTRRIRAATPGSNDLVTVFKDDDGDGNVELEKFYGGDDSALPDGYVLTADPSTTAQYSISHSSSYGVRASSQYTGALFLSLNLSVDPSGVPLTSTDSSGYTTSFTYNERNQLTKMAPPGEAWTEYKYHVDSSQFPPASVIVKQWPASISVPASDAVPLTQAHYYYDHFGRLIQQRSWMSSASVSEWSVVSYRYDELGRQISVSMPVGGSSGSYGTVAAPATITAYDALGRVTRVTQPDGSSVSTTYTGVGRIERFSEVRTDAGDVTVVTKEIYDALGRLTSVAEDSESAAQKTEYEYDEGDRLVGVTTGAVEEGGQERSFDYDGAGLLTAEDHPESNTTSYTYDSRGKVVTKTTPTATLTNAYDAAERIVSVTQSGVGTLQAYTYDSAGALGKMATAVRYNRHAGFDDITVTETFTYGGPGGRVSQKTTAVSGGPTFTDKYGYDARADLSSIEYPTCALCAHTPSRTVENVYTAGFLTEVKGYTKSMKYHPSGLLATLRRQNASAALPNGPLFSQSIDPTTRMPRPSSTSVTGYCDFAITAHPETQKTVTAGEAANITVVAPGATTYEWYVLGSSQKIANQMSATLTSPVWETTQFWVRAGNGTCTVDSTVATVIAQTCTPPDATISAPANIGPAAYGVATVAGEGTYVWSVNDNTATIVGNSTGKSVTFRAACSGEVRLNVSVRGSCGDPVSGSVTVRVAVPPVSVTASPSPIAQGQGSTLTASVSDGGVWDVTWSDAHTQSTTDGVTSRSVAPMRTTSYSVTHLNGCSGGYGSATVTVIPPAPVAMTASRTGSAIQIAWSMPAGATYDSFVVERCTAGCANAGAAWTPLGETSAPSFMDNSITSGKSYVYRARAIAGGTSSAPSPRDFATYVAFTDDPLVSGVSALRLTHLVELRAAVNALRTAAGLSQASFTDPDLAGVPVRTIHFTELLSALNAARTTFGTATVAFNPVLTSGSPIRAAHVEQLRGGVR